MIPKIVNETSKESIDTFGIIVDVYFIKMKKRALIIREINIKNGTMSPTSEAIIQLKFITLTYGSETRVRDPLLQVIKW